MVNYYHNMWIQGSEVLTPLTHLTSANVKFEWTNVEQLAFDKIKQIVRHKMLLSYPDFNQPFEIHTDASHTQLGVVISKKISQLPSIQGNFNWLKGDIQPLNVSCYQLSKLSKSSKTSFWDNKSWFILTTKTLPIKTSIRSTL